MAAIKPSRVSNTRREQAEYVDEAVMNLIMNSVLKKEEALGERFQKAIQEAGRLGFPPMHDLSQRILLTNGTLSKCLSELYISPMFIF